MAEEPFNRRDVELAISAIATMPFFPREEKAAIAEELVRMVPHKRALQWLVEQCRTRISEWPGLAELRGVLCSRFDAADGIDAYSKLPYFSPADGERRSILLNEQVKARELAGGSSEYTGALERRRRQNE